MVEIGANDDPLTRSPAHSLHNARITWQATQRNKFNIFWDEQDFCQDPCRGIVAVTASPSRRVKVTGTPATGVPQDRQAPAPSSRQRPSVYQSRPNFSCRNVESCDSSAQARRYACT